jgi:preprotein translocase subunit SecA
MSFIHAASSSAAAEEQNEPGAKQPAVRQTPKLGRNDPCYCGSGKKFKQCHGKIN